MTALSALMAAQAIDPKERQRRLALEYEDENVDFIFKVFGLLVFPMLPTGAADALAHLPSLLLHTLTPDSDRSACASQGVLVHT